MTIEISKSEPVHLHLQLRRSSEPVAVHCVDTGSRRDDAEWRAISPSSHNRCPKAPPAANLWAAPPLHQTCPPLPLCHVLPFHSLPACDSCGNLSDPFSTRCGPFLRFATHHGSSRSSSAEASPKDRDSQNFYAKVKCAFQTK